MARTSTLLAVVAVASCNKGLAPIPVPNEQLVGWMVATAAPDGRIYLLVSVKAPVDASFASSQELWSYDPRSNSWRSEPPLPTTRDGAALAAGPDGRLYAIGGEILPAPWPPSDAGTVFFSETDAYDPASRTWTQVASFPIPSNALAVTGPDGKIYALGGADLPDGGLMGVLAAFSTSTSAWTTLASPPRAPGMGGVAIGPDGRIYAIGVSADLPPLVIVEAYDPSANLWSTAAPLEEPRLGLSVATGSDGRIYAVGGLSPAASDGTICHDGESQAADALCLAQVPHSVEAYDVASNSWKFVAPLPTDRYALGVAAGADGRIYAFGGTSIPLPPDYLEKGLSVTEAYDPSTDSWSR